MDENDVFNSELYANDLQEDNYDPFDAIQARVEAEESRALAEMEKRENNAINELVQRTFANNPKCGVNAHAYNDESFKDTVPFSVPPHVAVESESAT